MTVGVRGSERFGEPQIGAAEESRVLGLREPHFFLVAGLIFAPAFAVLPVVSLMGWFLASLVHEMGHAGLSWFFGMPSVPAISIAGHAAAVHGEQVLVLVLAIWGGLVFRATRIESRTLSHVALGLAVVLYPLVAFSGAKELLHLLAGHGGELLFAIVCFLRAMTGGFTSSGVERWLYATLGWFLTGKNLHLSFGLMFSAGARAEYATSGSFGLTNDYLRVSNQLLCPLPAVAGLMGLAALCVLPIAWILGRVQKDRFQG